MILKMLQKRAAIFVLLIVSAAMPYRVFAMLDGEEDGFADSFYESGDYDFYSGNVVPDDDDDWNSDGDGEGIDSWGGDDDSLDTLVSRVEDAHDVLTAVLEGEMDMDPIQYEQLLEAIDEAEAALTAFCEAHNYAAETDTDSGKLTVFDADGDVVSRVGDPVVLASGLFQIDDRDISLSVGKTHFTLWRHYMSDVTSGDYDGGALGLGWHTLLDSRIILGSLASASAALATWDDIVASGEEALEQLVAYTQEDSNCESIQTEMQTYLEAWQAQQLLFSTAVKQSERRAEKNRFVQFGTAWARSLGNNRLIFVDDYGTPHVFIAADDGTYSAVRESLRTKITLSYDASNDCYAVYFASGEMRIYNEYGQLQTIQFAHGGDIQFLYNAAHKLTEIKIHGARTLQCTWNGNRLTAITDGVRTISYTYTAGKLTTVSDAVGDKKSFAYDDKGRIIRQIKADGTAIVFAFAAVSDGNERTVSTTNENGAKETFSYDIKNRRTTYTDPDGVQSYYDYDAQGRTIAEHYASGKKVLYTYDAWGNLLSRESMGHRTTYQYDAKNRRISARYTDGSSERWEYTESELRAYTDRDGVTTSFDYDARGNVIALYRGAQKVFTYAYNQYNQVTRSVDCRGNGIVFVYDAQGNCLQKKRFVAGEEACFSQEEWTYDAIGRVTSYRDARGITYTYHYEAHETFIRASSGCEITYRYNNRKDIIEKSINDTVTGEKRSYQYEYDACHQLIQVVLSGTDGTGKKYAAQPVSHTTYTGQGRVAQYVLYDADNSIAYRYAFDDAGILSELAYGQSDAQGTLGSVIEKVQFAHEWTADGYLLFETNGDGRTIRRQYDSADRLLGEYDGDFVRAKNDFSAAGRLLQAKTMLGGSLSFSYDRTTGFYAEEKEVDGTLGAVSIQCYADGKRAIVTHADGSTIRYFYDVFGTLCRTESDEKIETWTRDGAGRLLLHSIKNPAGVTVFEEAIAYNDDGRTKIYTRGGQYSTTFRLNAFGEIVLRIDAAGNKHGFVYDIRGRCIEQADAYGNKTLFLYNGKNQLIKKIDRNGNAITYAYDTAGNCIRITDASGTVFSAQFDKSQRLVRSTRSPTGVTVSYDYDGLDRITAVRYGETTVLQTEFSADGKNLTRLDANNHAATYTSDGFGRILSEKNRLGAQQTVAYKNDGTLQHIVDFAGETTTYAYERATGAKTISYSDGTYLHEIRDAAGQVVAAQNQSERLRFTYDTAGKLLSQYDEGTGAQITYTYDACGRRIRMQTEKQDIRYHYGKNSELIKIEDAVQKIAVQFAYDAEGHEVLRTHSTGESVASFYDTTGSLVLTVGYAADNAVVFVEGSVYDSNGRRTLILHTDLSVTRYIYDDFGRIAAVQYPYSDAMSAHLKKLCAEAGLYFNESTVVPTQQHQISSTEYKALLALCAKIGRGLSQPQTAGTILEERFSYDKNGNLVARKTPYGTITYIYNAENQLVSWGNGGSAQYDANGNLLESKNLYKFEHYAYNKANRMERAVMQNVVTEEMVEFACTYDAFGRRTVVSSAQTGSVRSVYDGFSLYDVYAVRERAGQTEQPSAAAGVRYRWISDEDAFDRTRTVSALRTSSATDSEEDAGYISLYGNTRTPIAVTRLVSEPERYTLFSDAVGTVHTTLKADATDQHFSYDAFGAKTTHTAWSPYGFAGKKSLADSTLYDFGFRDYAADSFRFTTSDPARDGLNWYTYCNGDSVNYVDVWGLELDFVVDKETQTMEVYIDGIYARSIDITTGVVSQDSKSKTDYSRTQDSSGHETHPTQFPDGTYAIDGQKRNSTTDPSFGDFWLTTNANQYLPDVKTGELIQDWGYCIHVTGYSNTNGCIGVKSQADMDFLNTMFYYNELNDPHSAKITVSESSYLAHTLYDAPMKNSEDTKKND